MKNEVISKWTLKQYNGYNRSGDITIPREYPISEETGSDTISEIIRKNVSGYVTHCYQCG